MTEVGEKGLSLYCLSILMHIEEYLSMVRDYCELGCPCMRGAILKSNI